MTPTPDANAFSDASKDPSFTDSNSTNRGDARSEDNSDEPKNSFFTGSDPGSFQQWKYPRFSPILLRLRKLASELSEHKISEHKIE